jgi:hypothetical protein
MAFLDWIPALSITGLLALVAWLCRKVIVSALTKGIEYKLNQKIEKLRAELRARESEIQDLRSGAMTALASRQAAVDKRRLEAVDQLWSAVTALGAARGISAWLSVINFKGAAEAAQDNPRAREMFATLDGNFDVAKFNDTAAQKARPFVSPMAWANYSAMHAVCAQAVMRWQALKTGLGAKDFVDVAAVNKLLTTVLPHQASYIEKYGPGGYHFLLDEIEQQLLQELQQMLSGSDSDRENLERAADIVKQSKDLLNQTSGAQQGAAADRHPATRAVGG